MRTFTPDDVPCLIDALTAFVGQANFDKCLATWRNTLGNARQIERAQAEQSAFYWWPGLAQYRQWRPGTPHALATLLLAKDAMKVLDMVATMPDSVKKEFAGALGDVTNAPAHLHEAAMAHHLAELGCQIQWIEQSGHRIPEFLASSPSAEFEVECKRISVDAGRLLARDTFARFGDEIVTALRKRKLMGRVHVALPRRLPKPAQQAEIVAALGAAVEAGQLAGTIDIAPWGHADMALQPVDDAAIDWDGAQARAQEKRPHQQHALVHAQSINAAPANLIHLTAESMERDAYLRTIYDTMKPAARGQLSGTRPGLLCIHVPEIRDFSSLLEQSGLKAMTEYFFSKPEHAHVVAVAYTSDTHVINEPSGYQFTGYGLAFKNAHCTFPDALGFRLFPDEAIPPVAASSPPQRNESARPAHAATERHDEQP